MGTMRTLGLIAVVMGAAEGYGQCEGPLFPQEAVGPISPGTVAVGDLNGDGADDLAIRTSTVLWISLSDGSGGFSGYEAPAGFSGPFEGGGGVSIADVNGDGLKDLLVTADDGDTPTLGRVYVGLNQGDGTFLASGYSPVGVWPISPLCIDADNDGALDLAIGFEDGLAILRNDGLGAFSLAQTFSLAGIDHPRVAGDFNEDGNVDLALIVDWDTPLTLFTLLGAGDGTFSPGPGLILDEDTQRSLTLGDFDEDGHLDLAVLRDTHTAGGHHVEIFFGQGDGSFIAGDLQPAPSAPRDILAGDYNQDSHLDVAIFDSADTRGHVVISLGAGDGTFTPDATYPTDERPFGAAQGDFNGDAALDFVARSYGRRTTVLLSEGDGSYQTQRTSIVDGDVQSYDFGDFDGDGFLDLVVGTADDDDLISEIALLLNDGEGYFDPAWSLPTDRDIDVVVVGNLNGDDIPDLAMLATAYELFVLAGTGDGQYFNAPATYSYGSSLSYLLLGDLNNDGLDDLITRHNTGGEYAVLLNPGDGDFSTVSSTIDTLDKPLALFDADADGDLDALFSQGYSTIAVALNDGTGGFAAPATYSIGNTGEVRAAATGDVDGDGYEDIYIGTEDPNGGDDFIHYQLLLLNQGDGTFVSEPPEEIESSPRYLFLLEDFDRDGDLDLAIDAVRSSNYTDRHRLRIRLNDGDGAFVGDRYYLSGVWVVQSRLADLNGDGGMDIITLNYESEDLLRSTQRSLTVLHSQCADDCIGDLDGDGDTDQADLGALLASYGIDDGGDLNGDGFTDQADLGALLGDYNCGE